jgi:hypothetical protein
MRIHQLATAALVLMFTAGMIFATNLFVARRSPTGGASLIFSISIFRPSHASFPPSAILYRAVNDNR